MRLTILCLSWRGIIAVKKAQLTEVADKPAPSERDFERWTMLGEQIKKLKQELSEMEDELCLHIQLPTCHNA